MVVGHSDVWAGELAVGEKMEEACFYSQAFHDQLKRNSDASNDLVQTSVSLLAHSSSADYSTGDLTVFVDDRHMQELQEEDATRKGIVVDSM